MNIEILAAYAPYGLQIKVGVTAIAELSATETGPDFISIKQVLNNSAYKPILRPLSELNGNHRNLGLLDVDYSKLTNYIYNGYWSLSLLDTLSYNAVQRLLADHYNVFNLPEGAYIRKV